MPNHPHLLADVDTVEAAHASLVTVLGAFTRRVPCEGPLWEPVPAPEIVVGSKKILQHLRYIALNATRAGIVDDPLAWYWSTYGDLVGAIHDPWVTFAGLRRYLPAHVRTLSELHAYVSADPSTDVRGTPLPVSAADSDLQERTIAEILLAAAAVTRGSVEDLRRRGPMRAAFVRLAVMQGWTDRARLAHLCGVTRQAIAKLLGGPPPASLAPARLCLGDRRLMHAVGGPSRENVNFGPPRRIEEARS